MDLQQLDLSSNALRGELPHWLGALPRLLSANLSYNQLEGRVPQAWCSSAGMGPTFTVEGNADLNGASACLHVRWPALSSI